MALSKKSRKFLALGTTIIVVYACIVVFFLVQEDSFVYFPRKGLRDASAPGMNIEQVVMRTDDSVKLVGWIVPAITGDTAAYWLLYLHGNGGNISSRGYVSHYRAFQVMGVNTFALDYRGYGASEGTPSEQGLYSDAMTAFSFLRTQRQVPSERIVIFGYSLGSSVAIDLASKVEAAGVILEGAFTSMPNVGQRQYPFLPVHLMMRNRYDSMSKIQAVNEPKLFFHAREDEIIPFEEGVELFGTARETKQFVETKGGHNTVHTADSALFYGTIARFLRQIEKKN